MRRQHRELVRLVRHALGGLSRTDLDRLITKSVIKTIGVSSGIVVGNPAWELSVHAMTLSDLMKSHRKTWSKSEFVQVLVLLKSMGECLKKLNVPVPNESEWVPEEFYGDYSMFYVMVM